MHSFITSADTAVWARSPQSHCLFWIIALLLHKQFQYHLLCMLRVISLLFTLPLEWEGTENSVTQSKYMFAKFYENINKEFFEGNYSVCSETSYNAEDYLFFLDHGLRIIITLWVSHYWRGTKTKAKQKQDESVWQSCQFLQVSTYSMFCSRPWESKTKKKVGRDNLNLTK